MTAPVEESCRCWPVTIGDVTRCQDCGQPMERHEDTTAPNGWHVAVYSKQKLPSAAKERA